MMLVFKDMIEHKESLDDEYETVTDEVYTICSLSNYYESAILTQLNSLYEDTCKLVEKSVNA